jgi:host factor-I protein
VEALSKEWPLAALSTSSLQDTFLKHFRDNNVEVTMFLVNGIKLLGRIKRFDSFTIQLVRGDSSQIIYKHAISTIHPAEPVLLPDPDAES